MKKIAGDKKKDLAMSPGDTKCPWKFEHWDKELNAVGDKMREKEIYMFICWPVNNEERERINKEMEM